MTCCSLRRRWPISLIIYVPGPVAAAGGKWPSPWLWPLPVWVAYLHAPFVNDFTGFDRPWRLLAQFVPNLRIHQLAFTTGYLALSHAGARLDTMSLS